MSRKAKLKEKRASYEGGYAMGRFVKDKQDDIEIEALKAENAELCKVLAKGHDECEKCGAFVAVWTEEEIADAKAEGKKLAESLKWDDEAQRQGGK